MEDYRLTERVYDSDVEGRRARGRAITRKFDGVKNVCDASSAKHSKLNVKCPDGE